MLWLALDDTDSREGGCTTWLVQRVLDAFPERRLAGAPRLVRLNPAVPWKTRGNGAVAIPLTGPPEIERATAILERIVDEHARRDPQTSPGWVASPAPLDPSFYLRAVREVVPGEAADAALRAAGAAWGGRNGGRGRIGCAGALAWPARRATWEWIAYRPRGRWGAPREVDAASVAALESAEPAVFDSYDARHRDLVMVPSSPCPVLWGVRATTAEGAARAAARVRGEPAAESTLFLTNHASDDHLVPRSAANLGERRSAVLSARVTGEPEIRGGHAFLPVEDATGEALLAAYAPTRSFRSVVAALVPGDTVLACGQVTSGRTLNLEKLRVDALAPRRRAAAKPPCPSCGRTLRSAGRGAPLRCRRCGTRAPRGTETVAAGLAPGWHEVPPCARRHLARPLRLLRTTSQPSNAPPP